MCMWASLCLNQSKLIWMDHWIDHGSYTHDGITSIQWCNSVQLKWNSIIWNWSTYIYIYMHVLCFRCDEFDNGPCSMLQLELFKTCLYISIQMRYLIIWSGLALIPAKWTLYILYCDIYLMTDRASLDTRNWRMETCLSRQCHTYPARIEVMVTAEPTATPARSPICQNKNKGRQKQKGGNIWSSIYVRRRSKKSIFVTYNSQVRTTT